MENIYIELARLEIYQSRTLPRNHAGVLKVKKIQLEITLSMLEAENKSLRDQLRTAEQELSLRKEYDESLSKVAMERDQYKAELVECSRIIEQLQATEHQKHLELESLRAKIKEMQEN